MPGDPFDLVYKNREKHLDSIRWALVTWMFDLETEFCHKLKQIPYTSILATGR